MRRRPSRIVPAVVAVTPTRRLKIARILTPPARVAGPGSSSAGLIVRQIGEESGVQRRE
jgi:hypothetical protein